MIMWRLRQYRIVILALAILLAWGLSFGVSWAEDASSSNYKVTNTQFGAGSGSGCSTSYCANSSAGTVGGNNGSSTSYQAQFTTQTPGSDTPLLEVIEDSGQVNLGIIDPNSTATVTNQVKVKAYNVSGYTLQISGAPPSQGYHSLTPLSTPTASHPGTEQFGINLAANTTPNVGTAPAQVPDSSFSFGVPTSNYGTANKFMYNDGDAIASSSSSSGETDYTLSMIFNVSYLTPGGQYTGAYNTVVVPVY